MSKLSDRIRPNSEAAPWVIEEVKQLEVKVDLSQRRILELELEVKRLREFLNTACELLHVPEHAQDDEWYRKQDLVNASLSTSPPAALASAYVRLRDAAKCQLSGWPDHFHYDGPNLETALAEIERLEKGE